MTKFAVTGIHEKNRQEDENDLGELVSWIPTTLILETESDSKAEAAAQSARADGWQEVTISRDDGTPFSVDQIISSIGDQK